jgi:N-acetylmuramoyl-L-alanine amidase
VTDPDRVVLDFREVDFTGLDLAALAASDAVHAVTAGPLRAGWSRMVLQLAQPMNVAQAGLEITERTAPGGALLRLELAPASRAAFDAAAGAPASPGWTLRAPRLEARPAVLPDTFTVVIDPGHGGIDPGAIRRGHEEADLVLRLALELEEALLRAGNIDVVMTRRRDAFVSLERRVAIAAQAGAHVFVSIHADALAEGVAQGATLYTLSETASDAASAALAERHNRVDLLAGVDLSGADDEVAQVLMDLARHDSAQRSEALARALVGTIEGAGVRMHKRPLQSAGFSVLKSADIPSVLIEAAFLSTDAELERLLDPAWRARMIAGIRDGLLAWAAADRAVAPLRRK